MQFFGRKTAFGSFSADIYLQKNILTNTAFLGFLGDSLAEMNRADRLNQRNLADQVLDLVGLQRADKLKVCSIVGVLFILLLQFLYAVFAAHTDSRFDSRLHALGVIHFGRSHQCNFTGIAPCLHGGIVYALDHRFYAFLQFFLFLLRHVFTTILFCRFLP